MSSIRITIADGVQVIRICRPEKKNALTGAMYAEISDALSGGDADPAVGVHVFLGQPGCFSAGNDISDFLSGPAGAAAALTFVRQLPFVLKPIVAAVDGLAVGIGTTLLFHCDLVYASQEARFQTPFLDLGLVPEAGSSLLAPRLMGHARAFELLVLGETFDATHAAEAGLVNRIVPAQELEAHAMAAAMRLASKPPEALRLSRQLLRGDPAELDKRVTREAELFEARLSTPEAREAFAAFLAKRPPNFRKGET
ncbi:MAG: hypothetical protein RLZ98_2679 [Pseudomonadota bacterium]